MKKVINVLLLYWTPLRRNVLWRVLYNSQKMKIKEVLKILEEDGWYIKRIRGDHRQLKHREKT